MLFVVHLLVVLPIRTEHARFLFVLVVGAYLHLIAASHARCSGDTHKIEFG